MTAPMQNGQAATEVTTLPIATDRALIPQGDPEKITPRYTMQQVGVGIARFLEDLRITQAIDAEPEFTDVCSVCRIYPVFRHGECASCQTSRRWPS